MCGIEIAGKLKYFSVDDMDALIGHCDELSAMIGGLKRKLMADS